MAKVAFFILRLLTAIASVAGLALVLFISVLTAFVDLLKGGANIFLAVATLFLSGFQKSTNPPPPDPIVAPSLIVLGAVFLAMFVSVFLPGQKIFLHVIAGTALVSGVWRCWGMTNPEGVTAYIIMIAFWFLYYAVCLRRA